MPPSRAGCQTCKIRRIKCDDARPICQRCRRARRICLGSAAARDACFAVLVENSFASGKSKRPRGPRSSLTLLRPHFDLQTRALAYYLKYHLKALEDIPNVSGGLSECVSAWKTSGRTCDMVDLALSSTALAAFARTQHHPPAATEACSNYSRLLRIVQDQIAQLNTSAARSESIIDACLISAFLMARYETVTHRQGSSKPGQKKNSPQSFHHYDGLMAILKVWKDDQDDFALSHGHGDPPAHRPASFIIKHTRRQLIKVRLLRDLPVPDWLLDGSLYSEHGMELDFDRILVSMTNLRHRSVTTCWTPLRPGSSDDANDDDNNDDNEEGDKLLLIEARQLDYAVQAWSAQISSRYSRDQYHLATKSKSGTTWPPRRRIHFYSSVVYGYADVGQAALWIESFATRMFISNLRLDILERWCRRGRGRRHLLEEEEVKVEWQECMNTLQEMADNLAHSVPFCLEKIKPPHALLRSRSLSLPSSPHQGGTSSEKEDEDEESITPYLANWIAWPLSIASSMRRIDPLQRRWFQAELAHLGRSIGDGMLERAVDVERWGPGKSRESGWMGDKVDRGITR